MAKKIYIGHQTTFLVTNLIDYNTWAIEDSAEGYWGRWHKTNETDYVNVASYPVPPGNKFCGVFVKNITSGLIEALYTLCTNKNVKIPLDPSHKYYFSVDLYQPSVVGSFDCYWPIAEPPVISNITLSKAKTWEKKSAVFTRSSFSAGTYEMRFDFNEPTVGSALNFANTVLVDLTATFGAGREPDKDWCDKYLIFQDTKPSSTNTASINAPRDLAQRVKKMYIGVSNKARKIMRGYIGIGGKARMFYSQYPIECYGAIDPLSSGRDDLMAASIGDYAIFAGGTVDGTDSGNVATTDCYNKELTRVSIDSLSVAVSNGAAGSNSTRAVFAAGGGSNGITVNSVSMYTSELTRSTTTLSFYTCRHAAATIGDYVFFAGGYSGGLVDSVNKISNTGSRSTASSLAKARYRLCGGNGKNHALFAGGYISSMSNDVDAFDSSGTRTTPEGLSVARDGLVASSGIDSILVAGGRTSTAANSSSNVVDVFSPDLTRSILTPLSVPRRECGTVTLNGYVLFAGGYGSGSYRKTVDVYTPELTRSVMSIGDLQVNRYKLEGVKAGSFGLFGGGSYTVSNVTTYSNAVDAYEYLEEGE